MLKRVRENKKGFTLAELLIVVAIIGVLVAVSIPIFTAQLAKARLATNQANARAAKAAAVAAYLENDSVGFVTYKIADGVASTATTGTAGSSVDNEDISAWTTNGTAKFGSAVYKTWYVVIGADGKTTISFK